MNSSSATPEALPDLDRRSRIHDLVVDFYREVAMDEVLGPVFNEVAEVDWAEHIPKLIDYWCRVLLRQPGYDGYILRAHQRVAAVEPFRAEMFDRWFQLFVDAVDREWCGPVADRAKEHAAQIANVLSRQVVGENWAPTT